MASQPLAIDERKRIGRPTVRTTSNALEIITRLSEGETLASICADDHMPSYSTARQWETDDPLFSAASAHARETGTHYIADDSIRIADDPSIAPAHKRVMVDTRLRLIGQWNRKVYGQSVQLEGEIKISIAAALDAAHQRVIEGTSTRIATSSDEPSSDDDL